MKIETTTVRIIDNSGDGVLHLTRDDEGAGPFVSVTCDDTPPAMSFAFESEAEVDAFAAKVKELLKS